MSDIEKSQKHIPFDEVLKDKENYANLFADGDAGLKRLLLHCFNNNIETYLSCVSYDEEDNTSYLLYCIPYERKDIIHKIVNSVYGKEGVFIGIGKRNDMDSILIDIQSFYGSYIFNDMYNGLIDRNNDLNHRADITNMIELANKFNHPSYDFSINAIRGMNGDMHYNVRLDQVISRFPKYIMPFAFGDTLTYEQIVKKEECYDMETLDKKAVQYKKY